MRVVISQPMFFPWPGLFEQIKLCDVFVHYDDVALPQGRSFVSRVQIKSQRGSEWLTAPVKRARLIKDVELDNTQRWRAQHINMIGHLYAAAPFGQDMKKIVQDMYDADFNAIADLNIATVEKIAAYLGLEARFIRSSSLGTVSSGSQKLLDIVCNLAGSTYITGHGARNYLDHELFERAGISVEYMNYKLTPYPQLHGDFNPYVSILDAIGNLGCKAKSVLNSNSQNWRDFLNE